MRLLSIIAGLVALSLISFLAGAGYFGRQGYVDGLVIGKKICEDQRKPYSY